MLASTTPLRKAKATPERESKIEAAMKSIVIDQDENGVFAIVKASNGRDIHIVSIDESGEMPVAVSCTCNGNALGHYYCVCMESVDRFYARMHQSVHAEAVPVEVADSGLIQAIAEHLRNENQYAYEVLAKSQQEKRDKADLNGRSRGFSMLRQ